MATRKIHLALAGLVLAVGGVAAVAALIAPGAPGVPDVPEESPPLQLTPPVTGAPAIPSGGFANADQPLIAQGGFKTGDRLPSQPSSPTQAAPVSGSDSDYRKIDWENLIPADWDPMAAFKGLKLDEMDDADPRAQLALLNARKLWREAPVDTKLDGAAVKLAGFVVSLSGDGQAMKEFLLVPYFGACIHVPPPPANQVIHVKSSKAIKDIRSMDAVWVSGKLGIDRTETMMGTAAYRMDARHVELYEPAFVEIPAKPER